MLRWIAIGIAGAAAVAAWVLMRPVPDAPQTAGAPSVPSGQAVTHLDTIQAVPGPEGLTFRFRFVAPAIARQGGTVSAEAAQKDMEWLCQHYALPRLPKTGPVPEQVVISLSDRPMEFGATNPDATQFFEAFRVEKDTCHWEAF
ncbi:MAG: DUF6497 family protein [Albidovulum sp.]|uniref:DUF6497 family protein n=1 Tax=Albidovulum sp. TaxID=1872424 RepID=UPI003CA55635